ncbi:MAG: LPXTG cell wall anchor domain-containing protein, partial [Actinomycetota bacterium]|nr:LPXTG cell wall anchor domain-containing protein [Actinomycetota bacterium]
GEYRILMGSSDGDHAPGYQPEQTGEQWFFTTDAGYTSPVTPDLAETDGTAIFDMGVVTLADTQSISFHHASTVTGANSVLPQVTFDPQVPPCGTVTTQTVSEPTTTAGPASTEAPVTTAGVVAPSSTVKSVDITTATTPPAQVNDRDNLPATGTDGALSLALVGVAMILVGWAATGRGHRPQES